MEESVLLSTTNIKVTENIICADQGNKIKCLKSISPPILCCMDPQVLEDDTRELIKIVCRETSIRHSNVSSGYRD